MSLHKLIDPQSELDDEIQQHRPMESDEARRDYLIKRWLGFALGSRKQANWASAKSAGYDERLHATRAQVRDEAANLLRGERDLIKAARMMMAEAKKHQVTTAPPIIGFDEVSFRYVAARTWQLCAWDIDPELEPVQPRWD
jgi:hypothetical protein